eukprot:jgi/Bigna1/132596/aug1.18_g7304
MPSASRISTARLGYQSRSLDSQLGTRRSRRRHWAHRLRGGCSQSERCSNVPDVDATIVSSQLERARLSSPLSATHALSSSPKDPQMIRQCLSGVGGRVLLKRCLENASRFADTREALVVKGWIRSRRIQGKGNLTFVHLSDGSCCDNLQVVFERGRCENYDKICEGIAGTGASIAVKGEIVPSFGSSKCNTTTTTTSTLTAAAGKCEGRSPTTRQQYELHAHSVEIIGGLLGDENNGDGSSALPKTLPYPLAKKRHSMEYLRTIAHLRPRSNLGGAVARVRSIVALHIHNFLQENGFRYVHTPIITKSDCEIMTKNISEAAAGGHERKIKKKTHFFGQAAYLTVSGQLNLEAYCCGIGDCYAFGPTFRAENSHTGRHLAEFWMVEPEMAFANMDQCLDLAVQLLQSVAKTVIERCPEEVQFFAKFVDAKLPERLRTLAAGRVARITKFSEPIRWGMDLKTEHERFLAEDVFSSPLAITDYPKDLKAFYMRVNSEGDISSNRGSSNNTAGAVNKTTVAAFDILMPGLGEVVGGSQREERLSVLRRRIEEVGLDEEQYGWSIPHSGFGVGFDRLVQVVTGVENIRDVVPFPRVQGSIDF